MMRLHRFVPHDRSLKAYWLLRELNLEEGNDFEIVSLNFEKGDSKTAEFINLSPLAQVPALEDGIVQICESTAILNYLADKYGHLGFSHTSLPLPLRSRFYQWLALSISMESIFSHVVDFKFLNEDGIKKVQKYWTEKSDLALSALTKKLSSSEFVLQQFSIVDINLAYSLRTAYRHDLTARYPIVEDYLKRLSQRPAAQGLPILPTKD